MFDEQDFAAGEEEKSKSQIKREFLELQDLGARLALEKPEILQKMPLNDQLIKALEESKRHTKHIARKRHNQYLGKLLRGHDVEAILAVLQQHDTSSREYNDRFHALERWRERLLEQGDAAVQEWMQHYPDTDAQHLRGILRHAQHELKQNKPPAAARKLFRYLREIEEQTRSGSQQDD